MAGQVTQQDIYDRIADVDNKLTELSATVREQMRQGAATMGDHEARIRLLEQARWRATGAAAVLGAACGGVAGTVLAHVWH